MTNAKEQTAGCKTEATFINWRNFYQDCTVARDYGDDVFRIVLERAEKGSRSYAESSPEEREKYTRMTKLLHGFRLAGSIEELYDQFAKSGIKLTSEEEIVIDVFGMLDTRGNVKLLA